MPELPEVEVVLRTLEKNIRGEEISSIDIYYGKIIQEISEDEFKNNLIGKQFLTFNRVGKYLIFGLSDDTFLVSHLRMEGKYFIKEKSEKIEKHEHIVFNLKSGKSLRYHDTRKFGVMLIRNSSNLYNTLPLSKLATDANKIEPSELKTNLKTHQGPIKEVLLDQTVIAGIGNIYADEILFLAKINPLQKANTLTDKQIEDICIFSKEILNKAILSGGTTIRSYTSSLGVTGRFQQELYVHTMDNKPCPKCGETILKMKVAGRSTYYCPACQK